jgi:predicted SprT family Zn-dependent metalloprotease
MRDYFVDLEKWENSFYCNECNCYEIKDFAFDRTVANGEVWHCKNCKNEIMVNDKPNEDNY